MHQLTKDPELIGTGGQDTAGSPLGAMSPFELARYPPQAGLPEVDAETVSDVLAPLGRGIAAVEHLRHELWRDDPPAPEHLGPAGQVGGGRREAAAAPFEPRVEDQLALRHHGVG